VLIQTLCEHLQAVQRNRYDIITITIIIAIIVIDTLIVDIDPSHIMTIIIIITHNTIVTTTSSRHQLSAGCEDGEKVDEINTTAWHVTAAVYMTTIILMMTMIITMMMILL